MCVSAPFCLPLNLGMSMMESLLPCGGVGVLGLVGDPALDPVGVVSSLYVHAACLNSMGDGEPVVSDILAMRSSDEPFVWLKSWGDKDESMGLRAEMPRPSIFAAAVSCCWERLSGSVAVVEGMEKSSWGESVFAGRWAPFTTRSEAFGAEPGLFHSGWGRRPMMFNFPVPARAQSQMPRRGGDWGPVPFDVTLLSPFAIASRSPFVVTSPTPFAIPSRSSLARCGRGGGAPSEFWRCSSRAVAVLGAAASSAAGFSGVMALFSLARSAAVSGLGG